MDIHNRTWYTTSQPSSLVRKAASCSDRLSHRVVKTVLREPSWERWERERERRERRGNRELGGERRERRGDRELGGEEREERG